MIKYWRVTGGVFIGDTVASVTEQRAKINRQLQKAFGSSWFRDSEFTFMFDIQPIRIEDTPDQPSDGITRELFVLWDREAGLLRDKQSKLRVFTSTAKAKEVRDRYFQTAAILRYKLDL